MENVENISDVTQCPVCKKKNLKRVLVHIERSKSCKTRCPKDVLEALKEKSKKITLKTKAELLKKYRNKNNDDETFKKMERERIQKYRSKKNEEDSEMFKKKEREYKQKSRKNETPNERLKEFLSSTMHNAVFICICCHIRCFK